MPTSINGQILFRLTNFLASNKRNRLISIWSRRMIGVTVFKGRKSIIKGTEIRAKPKPVNPEVIPARKIIINPRIIKVVIIVFIYGLDVRRLNGLP